MKRKILLIFSLLLNVALIFFFVSKINEPTFKELENTDSKPQILGQEGNNSSDSEEIKEENSTKVTKVIDGDTIVLESGETVRYIGIDTPETGDKCFAKEASEKNEELVLGKEVRLEKDISERDRYGRLLSYVYIGSTFINETLVKEGYATAVTYPPDVKFAGIFREAEKEAREDKRGLWGECNEEVSKIPRGENVDQVDQVGQVVQGGNWECSANTYNCTDFKTQVEAQSVFEACGGSSNDVHKLDRDEDGKVCESLP